MKSEQILIIAPVGNDAMRMKELLQSNGFQAKICLSFVECCAQVRVSVGLLLFTEEALELPGVFQLFELLETQPPWSEIPVIILGSGGESRLLKMLNMAAKAAGGITLLERPIGTVTLLRSVEVALRSRKRQYQVRSLMEVQDDVAGQLEKRVTERTLQLEEQAQQLRHLALELTEIEESERKRLAQVLHDHLQQLLVAAKIRLEVFQRKNVSTDVNAIKEVLAFLEEAYDASRSLTAELRPPVLYESGLMAALHFLARKYQDQHKLTVHISASKDVEPQSDIFKTFAYQSVQELLFNIVKYSGVNECFLKVERIGENIHLELRDEGVGFDAMDIGKKGAGGFGLFSIRERMKALGGELRIVSSPGNGATFEIIIPDVVKPHAKQEVDSLGHAKKAPKTDGGSIKILIADDHKIVRQSLATVLAMQPFIHEVLEAENGKDAILQVEKYNPDIVIMDLNMPYINGLEATRILHRRNPDLKIIGLSVQSEEEIAQEMKKAGAVGYFNKNTDTNILVDVLKDILLNIS